MKQESTVHNLTDGSVRRQLTRYALPMVAISLLQALYSMTDIIISGHFVGNVGISAINNSGQVLGIVTNIAIGVTMGGNILISQFFGAGDQDRRKEATGTLFSLSLLLGVFGAVMLILFARPMLVALGAPALEQACDYLNICALGLPMIFGYNALSSVLRAVGNSKTPMHIVIAATLLNVALDLLFVGPLQMGTKGAAAATVIAQTLSFLLALLYMLRHRELFELRPRFFKIRPALTASIFKLGIPSALQNTIGSISWLVVTFLINSYGVDVSAGNGVAIKIKDFCQLFTAAMANSAASMIAQTLGAKKFDRAKQVMDETMKITLLISAGMIAIVELFTPQLVAVFTSDAKVAEAAVLNLRIEILAQVFYASFPVYNALAIGAGHSLFAMANSFVNCILFRVVLAVTLNHFFGIVGLYTACMLAPAISVFLGHLYAKSRVWRRSLA